MTAIAASASKPGTSPVEGPQVWRGAEMAARPTEWIYEMSAADNADLNAATAAAISTGKNILDIEAVDFSLPQFGDHIYYVQQYQNGVPTDVYRQVPCPSPRLDL